MKNTLNFLKGAATMPPLAHSVDGETFNIDHSDAANWIASIPKVRQALFDKARASGLIVFDQASKTWKGKDFPS